MNARSAVENPALLTLLGGLFVASLLIANTVSTKILAVYGLFLPAGILVYPLVSVLGDVVTEVYGYRAARRVIWAGLAAIFLQVVVFYLARTATPAPFYAHDAAFNTVLAAVPRITVASALAYPVGEFINAALLSTLKYRVPGLGMAPRFVLSTFAGQAVDSLIFMTIAFAGTVPTANLLQMMTVSCAGKVAWECLALPLSLTAASWLKRRECVDVVDGHQSLSPFRW